MGEGEGEGVLSVGSGGVLGAGLSSGGRSIGSRGISLIAGSSKMSSFRGSSSDADAQLQERGDEDQQPQRYEDAADDAADGQSAATALAGLDLAERDQTEHDRSQDGDSTRHRPSVAAARARPDTADAHEGQHHADHFREQRPDRQGLGICRGVVGGLRGV